MRRFYFSRILTAGVRKTDSCNTSNQVGAASRAKMSFFLNCRYLDFIRFNLALAQNA
jgi:hypothetical protein